MAIHVFDSQQSGAPVINEDAGTVVAMLSAVLVDGVQPAYSPISITASGGVATITFDANHDLLVEQRVRIGGVTTGGYNGDWPVTQIVTPQSVRVQLPAAPAANVASGPATVKRAPIPGWTRPYAATNKAAFRGPNGRWLRVDDTNSRSTSVRRFDDMVSVDAGTGMWPRADQTNTCLWNRNSFGYGPQRRWAVLSNGDLVYVGLTLSPYDHPLLHRVYLFGTRPSLIAGDAPLDLIAADGQEGGTGYGSVLSQISEDSNWSYSFMAARTGVGGGPPVLLCSDAAYASPFAGFGNAATFNANVSDSIIGGNVLLRKALLSYAPPGDARPVRALLPHYAGLYRDLTTANGTIRDDVVGFEGRRFYVLRGRSPFGDTEGDTLWFPLDTWE